VNRQQIIERMARATWPHDKLVLQEGESLQHAILRYAYEAAQPLIVEECAEVADGREKEWHEAVKNMVTTSAPATQTRRIEARKLEAGTIATAIRALKEDVT